MMTTGLHEFFGSLENTPGICKAPCFVRESGRQRRPPTPPPPTWGRGRGWGKDRSTTAPIPCFGRVGVTVGAGWCSHTPVGTFGHLSGWCEILTAEAKATNKCVPVFLESEMSLSYLLRCLYMSGAMFSGRPGGLDSWLTGQLMSWEGAPSGLVLPKQKCVRGMTKILLEVSVLSTVGPESPLLEITSVKKPLLEEETNPSGKNTMVTFLLFIKSSCTEGTTFPHRDCLINKFVWRPVPSRCLVWAWPAITGCSLLPSMTAQAAFCALGWRPHWWLCWPGAQASVTFSQLQHRKLRTLLQINTAASKIPSTYHTLELLIKKIRIVVCGRVLFRLCFSKSSQLRFLLRLCFCRSPQLK